MILGLCRGPGNPLESTRGAGLGFAIVPLLGSEREQREALGDALTDDEASDLLRTLSTADDPPKPTATRIVRHRGGGGSDAWDIAVGSDIYVTKFANNPQEPARPAPRKVVVTELVVGRIGQLFRNPVCPMTRVIMVPRALIDGEPIYMGASLADAGPACGSSQVPHATETKAGGQLSSVPLTRVAQITTFQALLQADDPAALVLDDGSWAYSIDHGHYFGGGAWGKHTGPAAELPRINPIGGVDAARLRDRSIWNSVIAELEAIGDEALADAFVDVPAEWGCDAGLLGPILGATSRRKERIREVIDDYC